IASRCNNRLGGKDFDERIEKYILEEFKKQYGKDLYDGLDNSLTISIKERVKEAAIKAKKELSVQMLTEINIPFITMINGAPISINIEFTRAKFDELTKDLVLSTKDTVNKALKASGLNKEEIDIVLLIGGSSRIVAVKDLVDKMFPNKVKSTINPDEAVAMGAAIQAGIKTGQISSENSLIVTDKCNYNLGTSVVSQVGDKLVEGVFDCIIPVDSSIPCSKKHIYTTVYDNQTSVNIEVYEGYAPLVHENKKIDGFKLMGIPKAYAGEESIEIEFSYDLNGTLEVKATIVSTGKTITKVIDNSMIIKSSGNLEKYMVNRVDLDGWSECELAQVVKRTVELAEKKMKKLEGHKVNDLRPLLDKLKQAVIDGNEELVEKYDEELTEILFNM
ncbi:MAG: Hsp70 family protein, partial [Bacilli bacterium]|nr:Hsp70 family protein [Bacilli bacterium]